MEPNLPVTWSKAFDANFSQNETTEKSNLALRHLLTHSDVQKQLSLAFSGVPSKNNRDKLLSLSKRYPSMIPEVLKPCLEILQEKTLADHNSTTLEQRDQKIQRMHFLNGKLPTLTKGSKVFKGVELFAECFDETPVVEFLMLLSFDPSLATLWGVHYFLWGVSILKLGTKKHWDKYLEPTNKMDIIGCCMMTEIGHGSNVLGLETTATYDHAKRGFWVHTPNLTSCKCWIGGGGKNATHGVGFFRLILQNKDYGVHPFALELRDKSGNNLPGIETIDLGRKKGLNGVDNAIIKFKNVFIPYDSLLDHYSEIDKDGVYQGKNGNRNPHTLIYKLMIQFIFGRKYITIASEMGMALITTLFYCYPPQTLPKSLFRHIATDFLAKSYALKFARSLITGKHAFNHWRASIMKAISSEMNQKAIQDSIKYYGFHPETLVISTLLKSYRGDQDATVTYEGDNKLLYQLFSKFTLDKAKDWMDGLTTPPFKSWLSLLTWAMNRKKPRYILLAHCLQSAKAIGDKLKPFHSNNEKYQAFCEMCQIDAIELAKMYGQFLILTKFKAYIKDLNPCDDKENIWHLYQIYAWSQVKELIKIKTPKLDTHYHKLEKYIPCLVAKFGFDIRWMDSVIEPPKESHSYDDDKLSEELNKIARDRIYQASL